MSSVIKQLAVRFAALALPASGLPAQAQAPTFEPPSPPPALYQQSPAVLARFPDVPIALDAPGLAPDRTAFTSQAEMEAHLQELKRRAPRFLLGSLGRSPGGRDIPYLVFTAEGHQDLRRVRRLRRPVVWLIGQQHGNEPAGGEAMLALASALADGELRPLLRRVTVVVVPRANPDGAALAIRQTSRGGYDMNRDHLLATLPETRAIQARMRELPADLVVDAHEYGVAGSWVRDLGGLSAWDATVLRSTHPAAPAGTTALADRLVLPAMERRLSERGVSSYVYLTGPFTPEGIVHTGGTAPGISRNYYGLTGAVSFLVETRGIGIGRQSFQRRVATHYLAAKGALESAAREGGTLRRTVADARRGLARERSPWPVGQELELTPATITVIDAETGRDKPLAVRIRDARRIRVTETRARPTGYLLAPGSAPAAEAFRIKGLRTCPVAAGASVPVEAFTVTRKGPITRATREASNLEQPVSVTLRARTVTTGADWVWAPMNQPGSAVIAASLEPDSVGSHVGVGVIATASDGTPPVFRVTGRAPRTVGRCS